jgi:membrane protease YdiL (CAAX protease family)
MMGSFFSMMFFAVLYLLAKPEAGRDLVGLGIVSTASFVLMAAYLLGRYPGGDSALSSLGVRTTHPSAFLWGVFLGVSAKVPAEQVRSWVDVFFPLTPEEQKAYDQLFSAQSDLHAASMLVVVAVMVPIAEEVFFRGAVYGALRRSRVDELTGVVITAIGFTLCHADLRQMLPLLLVALLLGSVRSRSGSLLPAIGAHAGFNGAAIVGVTYGALPELEMLSVVERLVLTVIHLAALYWFFKIVGRDARSVASRADEQLVFRPSPARQGAE